MSDIEKSRNLLDEIDDKIVKLYAQRMQIVKEIGIVKGQSKINLYDEAREQSIICRVTKPVDPEIKVFTKQLFMTILDTSKAYQSRYATPNTQITSVLKNALIERSKPPVDAVIACQGVEGSYSSIAAEKLFQIPDITYFKTFDGVFNAVESGLCQFGVLPIENSTAGSVNAVYDLMRKYNFHIVRSIKLPVRHSLLAKKGTTKKDLKEIFSHEQAITQCNEYLKQFKNVKITLCENTALAAKLTADSPNLNVASLSAPRCAEMYGLSALESDVQDSDRNYTRFICITKKLTIYSGADKISIMINLPHEPGSLNRLLSKFSSIGLNLTKLESRPSSGSNFEFLFYFDFVGDLENHEVFSLITDLSSNADKFAFLGCYREE
ncbi:MAG: chorismate mutase [Christensenellaceae bacterium]|jgi:chorismate mutase/prephenate dehydratase|nr:chorismate mutase [Christensenellaceae bacterium]